MSTSNGPIWSRCSIVPTYPSRSHFLRTLNRERWGKVRINVGANQKRKLEDRQERKQATNFKKTACYPSAVVQGAARRKNGLCEGKAQGNWDPRKGQQRFQPNPSEIGDRTTTLRRLLIGGNNCFAASVSGNSNHRQFHAKPEFLRYKNVSLLLPA